jgi:hypothetical protein
MSEEDMNEGCACGMRFCMDAARDTALRGCGSAHALSFGAARHGADDGGACVNMHASACAAAHGFRLATRGTTAQLPLCVLTCSLKRCETAHKTAMCSQTLKTNARLT